MLWLPPSFFDRCVPVTLKAALEQVPAPRGRQGQDYRLLSILALIIVSLLLDRRGIKAAFLLAGSFIKSINLLI